jgi:hypothetical protein
LVGHREELCSGDKIYSRLKLILQIEGKFQ